MTNAIVGYAIGLGGIAVYAWLLVARQRLAQRRLDELR